MDDLSSFLTLLILGILVFLLARVLKRIGWRIAIYDTLLEQMSHDDVAACFREREPLSDEAFHAALVAHLPAETPVSPEVAAEVRRILSAQSRVDLSRMHPGDRFDDELCGLFVQALDGARMIEALERHFAIRIHPSEFRDLRTVADLTALVARKTTGIKAISYHQDG